MSISVASVLLVLLLGVGAPSLYAQNSSEQERIFASFAPYKGQRPHVEGLVPGLTLDKSNAQLAASVLPPDILKYLAAGDFAVTVQATTDMPARQAYVDATLAHYKNVVVGDEQLQNFVAGRPFPLLDPQDPQAGLKAAWNMRYRDQGETAQMWCRNSLVNSNGGVERSQTFYFISMHGMHRPTPASNVPEWERHGVYSKQYNMMLTPSDMEGNQLVSVTYNNMADLQEQWAYDTKTRRTRKIVYNPYVAPEGGVTLIEDRSGFLGYIHHYNWRLVAEQVVLAPGPIRAAEPTWGGKANWYLVDPWELRQAMVIEATPKTPHPLYSRRVLYLDVQTAAPLYALVYDHAGQHKRTFFLTYRHPEFNPWGNEVWFAQTAAQASIDYQAQRATSFYVYKILHNRPVNASRFNLMSLMLYGR